MGGQKLVTQDIKVFAQQTPRTRHWVVGTGGGGKVCDALRELVQRVVDVVMGQGANGCRGRRWAALCLRRLRPEERPRG